MSPDDRVCWCVSLYFSLSLCSREKFPRSLAVVRRALNTAGMNQVYDFLYFFPTLSLNWASPKHAVSGFFIFFCLSRAKVFCLYNCNISPSRRDFKDQYEIFPVGLKDLAHSYNSPTKKKKTWINMRVCLGLGAAFLLVNDNSASWQ